MVKTEAGFATNSVNSGQFLQFQKNKFGILGSELSDLAVNLQYG
jgi:hypothetical protein